MNIYVDVPDRLERAAVRKFNESDYIKKPPLSDGFVCVLRNLAFWIVCLTKSRVSITPSHIGGLSYCILKFQNCQLFKLLFPSFIDRP